MLTNVANRITYSGNGNATEFAYQFKILDRTDIKVLLTDADGKEKLLTKDYYVDVEKNVVRYPGYAVGAEVPESERPAILPTGWKLTIYREVPVTQETDLPDQYPFNQVEAIGDKLTMIAQQLTDAASRSLKVNLSKSADVDTTIPWENGKSFRISGDGSKIELTEDPARVLPTVQNLATQTQTQAQSAIASAAAAAKSESSAKAYMDTTKDLSENVNVFIPSVDADGTLTWTNKAGLDNPAAVNVKGAKGDKGDQGIQGPRGLQGEQGVQGPAGNAATITIGSVTTSAPGTAASVTNSGTPSAAVLDFTIPQGAKGDKGDQGTGGGGDLSGYLPLTGGTVTGGITASNFQTGTAAANYFQCRKFRGEGDANSYYHAVDFAYSGHDSVDFYEYDPNWNFYKCISGNKSSAVLVGKINGNGWNGGAVLSGAPTAPTAATGTSTTQIATTAFVQNSLGSYVKTVNNITPDENGNVTITVSGGGSNITVDDTLSSTSTNAIQNKAVYAALDKKLDKNGTAAYAYRDSSGYIIYETYAKKTDVSSTYATKTELNSCVKTVNNVAPDTNGNVNITVSGGGSNITVDAELSTTSTNAIQNKAVAKKFDEFGTAWGQALATKADTADLATVATSGSYNDLTNKPTVVKSVNNTTPDSNGNVTITVSSGDSGVSLSEQNTWTAQQNFHDLMLNREKYTTYVVNNTSDTPITSTMVYAVTGAFTLDLSALAGALSASQSSVFTAYFAANADYSLTISNAGKLKYTGSASDVAITSAGLLLNIWMSKDGGGTLTSIVQASKLS